MALVERRRPECHAECPNRDACLTDSSPKPQHERRVIKASCDPPLIERKASNGAVASTPSPTHLGVESANCQAIPSARKTLVSTQSPSKISGHGRPVDISCHRHTCCKTNVRLFFSL